MDFDMKKMTMYLGCIVLAVFVVYLCTNMLSLNNKIVEGLISKSTKKTPEEVLQGIQKGKSIFENSLRIDKNNGVYRKILIGYEDLIHLIMLDQLQTGLEETGYVKPVVWESLAKFAGFSKSLGDIDEFLSSYKA